MKPLLMLLLTFSVLSGLHAAQPKSPTSGQIVVFRQWRFAGSLRSISFRVDGGPPIKIGNGCYVPLAVAPGYHVIHVIEALRNDSVGIHVEPGEKVYVDAHFGYWGFTFERAEDQAQAKAVVSTLRHRIKANQRYLKFSDISPFPVGSLVRRAFVALRYACSRSNPT
jgi:hypothetical protein